MRASDRVAARSLPFPGAGKEVDNMAYLIIAIVYLILGAVVVAKTA
jgi:hypothetical protein